MKKKMSKDREELKEKLIDFLYNQKPYDGIQKDLKVLAIFKERYEI